MLDELGGAFLRLLWEVVFEVFLRGPGYLIQWLFRPADEVHFDGAATFFFGLGFWITLFVLLWWVFADN